MSHGEIRCINFQPGTYDRLLSLIPEDRSMRILDVGAGQGYFCRRLKDLGYRVEACDGVAEGFKCPDVPFTKVDLNQTLPLPDDHFDCVVAIEVIEHLENHFQFMREMVRVTKPGGLIIITTPNVLSLPSRLKFLLYGYTDCAPFPLDPTLAEYFLEHINPISLPELLFHLERCDADLVALTTNRLRRSAWLPTILFYPLLALAIRLKFLYNRKVEKRQLRRRHIRWMLHPANLMGRITIAVGRKRMPKAAYLARLEGLQGPVEMPSSRAG